MPTMLDILRSKKKESSPAMKLMIMSAHDRKSICGCVEGKGDIDFYQLHVNKFLPEGYEFTAISGNGKPGVKKAFRVMNWSKFDKDRILFFVDRDLSDFVEETGFRALVEDNHNVYMTDGYSIEHEIVSLSVCEAILRDLKGAGCLSVGNIEDILANFEEQLEKFYVYMTEITAPFIVGFKNGEDPKFGAVKLDDLFSFTKSGDRCALMKAQDSPLSQLVSARLEMDYEMLQDDIFNQGQVLADKEARTFVHGKYALWFLLVFIKHISGGQTDLTEDNALETLSRYAKSPASLREFLSETALKAIGEKKSPS